MSLNVSDSLSLPWTEMNSPKLVNLAFVQARTALPVGNVSMAVHVDVGYSVKKTRPESSSDARRHWPAARLDLVRTSCGNSTTGFHMQPQVRWHWVSG